MIQILILSFQIILLFYIDHDIFYKWCFCLAKTGVTISQNLLRTEKLHIPGLERSWASNQRPETISAHTDHTPRYKAIMCEGIL